MSEFFGEIIRRTQGKLQRFGARLGARVTLVHADISIQQEREKSTIRYILNFSSDDPNDDKPMILDWRPLRTPPTAVAITGATGEDWDAETRTFRKPASVLDLVPGNRWHDVRIHIVADLWPNAPGSHAGARFLAFPEHLPAVARADDGPTSLTRIRLSHPDDDRFSSGAVFASVKAASEEKLLACVLANAAPYASRRVANGDVIWARDESSPLSTREIDALSTYLGEILEFLSYFFDAAGRSRIVVVPNVSTKDIPLAGTLLCGSHQWLGLTGQPHDADLVPLLARIWFGEGCGIVGPTANTVIEGVTSAIGLAWLRKEGKERYHSAVLSTYRAAASDQRTLKLSELGAAGQRALTGTIAVAVSEALQRGDEARHALARIVKERWGATVSDRQVLEALRASGVHLPVVAD
jgi:hypothetical protein